MVYLSKSLSFELPRTPSWEPEQRPLAPAEVVDKLNATSPHPSCALSSRAHFSRFLDGIKTKLAPHEYNTVCDVLLGTLAAPCAGQDSTQFKLALSHNCAAGACSSGTCELCINSDSRPCPSLLKQKYLLGDLILPACGAPASVKLVRLGSPEDYVSQEDMRKLPPFILQVCAMPLEYYEKHKDHLAWDTVHECKTITKTGGRGKKHQAILACRQSGHLEDDGFVSFPRSRQSARGLTPLEACSPEGINLPDIFFPNGKSTSAEALLHGKRPQLVLVVRAVHAATGAPVPAILPAASTPFHVATRRTKVNAKAYIPSMDQEVRVLEHIGDSCIDKLLALPSHLASRKATGVGLSLPASIPGGSVSTVGHMAALVAAVQDDRVAEGWLFRNTLKLNDAKLAELKEQLARAVQPDSNLRVFYCGPYATAPLPGLLPGGGSVDVGLVFTCTHGTVDLTERGICGVVMRSHGGSEVVVASDSLFQAPHLKPALFTHAVHAWHCPTHPGWAHYVFQGRRTARMPPYGTGPYPADPRKAACFTPSDALECDPSLGHCADPLGGDCVCSAVAGPPPTPPMTEGGTGGPAGDATEVKGADGHTHDVTAFMARLADEPTEMDQENVFGGVTHKGYCGIRRGGKAPAAAPAAWGRAVSPSASDTPGARPRPGPDPDPLAPWLQPAVHGPVKGRKVPSAEPPPHAAHAGGPSPGPRPTWMDTIALAGAMHVRPDARAWDVNAAPPRMGRGEQLQATAGVVRARSASVELGGRGVKRARGDGTAAYAEVDRGDSWLSFSDLPEIGSMLAAGGPSGDLATRMESQGIGLGGGMHDSAVLVANTAAAFYSGHLDLPGGRAGTPTHAYVAGSGDLECASGGG